MSSLEEFKQSRPVVYIREPMGTLIKCEMTEIERLAQWGVEPIVYVYTQEERQVRIRLGKKVQLTLTEPQPIDNTWKFTSIPGGMLKFEGFSFLHPYIFWEAEGLEFSQPTQGQQVSSDDLESFFEIRLSQFGFIERERDHFKDYWIRQLGEFKYLLIDFILNKDLEQYYPMQVSPKMPKLRLFMIWRPLDKPDDSFKRVEFPVLQRPEGDVVVEWGGIKWSGFRLK